MDDIRERVANDAYRVDPEAVAEALLRRLSELMLMPPPRRGAG